MKDWKQILYDIYAPEVGSIWAAPNGIWTNSFASNKSETDYHPSVVGKVSSCRTSCHIVPGTSKDYRKGSCVFKVKLNSVDPTCPLTYFLIELKVKSIFLFVLSQKMNSNLLKILKMHFLICRRFLLKSPLNISGH